MSPETIAVIIESAATILSLAALGLGFYVRATAANQITSRCETLEKANELKFDAARSERAALRSESETKIEALRTEIDAVRSTLDTELKSVTKGIYDRVNNFGDRLQHMEGRIDDMPRREDVFKVSLQLQSMAGDLKGITAKMESLEENSKLNRQAVARIESHIFKIES